MEGYFQQMAGQNHIDHKNFQNMDNVIGFEKKS
jgi:hypothetical protein